MQNDRNRRAFLLGRLITAFEATSGTIEDDFGHFYSGQESGGKTGDTISLVLTKALNFSRT